MVLIFAEVHPFGSVTAEPITVDIVSPAEVPKKAEPLPEPKAQPSDVFDLSSKSAPSTSPAPAAPEGPSAGPQKQAAPSTPRPTRPHTGARPPPPSPSAAPADTPPEPHSFLKHPPMLRLSP